ncbi:MAG TPA: YgeY family selenium metabolism-linked hydrolase [Firmicutes bacterium]|nr:YgeY family selenium metabolism-linked hydrolase [Bacillota bacterium]
MKTRVKDAVQAWEEQVVALASELVQIESLTGREENVIRRIAAEMRQLGYDHVVIDKIGNVIGTIGNGPTKILFDSHVDHVDVNDPDDWELPPYSGALQDGKLHGRGASDMKASAAASVYAGAVIKQLGLDAGKTIYVCCSVMEEDYDGEGLYRAIIDNSLDPDYVVICEPSYLRISLGHMGRAVYKINVPGVSSHGSAPEKGINAIYKANKIIARVEKLGEEYMQLPAGERPSLALTKIESTAVSINAIPASCTLYLDRRLTQAETETSIAQELDTLVAGTDATWEVYDAIGTSWTGESITLRSFLPAWEIGLEHQLTKGCIKAYQALLGEKPEMYKWTFSTNGVASAGRLGIPTIGFGAGIEAMAHKTNEYCPVSDIIIACEFYSLLPAYL